ncbi:hypothetical protein VTL71DRAFT_7328 [Oculimacula yallundae]|uniref:Major facilitator superfamily (MFS) profile domain-containing protein n=1 Tax=Oculimacula yallundae TaxID=86028 RepID=A0ABR4BWC8_9HELO
MSQAQTISDSASIPKPLAHNDVADENDAITMRAPKSTTKPLPAHLFYFMGVHFLIAFCEMILVVPLMRLFEQSLCFSYYTIHDPSVIGHGGLIPEALCKIVEIQHDLATIRGWKSLLDIIPVLLVAIPTGKLGDKYGRRKVLAGSLLGVMGSLVLIYTVCLFPKLFPLRLVYLGSIFLLFGGGLYTSAALMWAMASEVCDDEQRSVLISGYVQCSFVLIIEIRSRAYYYIFSAFYVAELVASFLVTMTAEISPWIPCGLAFGSLVVCMILLASMPNSRKQKSGSDHAVPEGASLINLVADQDSQTSTKVEPTDLISLFSNTNILLSIPVFIVGTLRYTTLNVLIQYASIRFGWKISDGAAFYSETAIVNIILYSLLVPRLVLVVRAKFNIRPQVMDMVLMRTCVCLMAAGALILGFAPFDKMLYLGVFIFSAGFGSRVSTLSFTSYMIPDNSKASFYAAVAILENIGHALGDPAMQQILAAVMRGPKVWLATPFFFVAGLYISAGIVTLFLRVEKDGNPKTRERQDNDGGHEYEPLLA